MKFLFLSLAVLFNIAAYTIFKSISGRQIDFRWHGTAYPVFSAASISIIVLLSFFLFRERLSMINIIGAGIVILGVFLLMK